MTDSASDLPTEILSAYDITVVPLTVRFGETNFIDGVDLSSTAFWARLASSDRLPETSAPGVGLFLEAYEKLAANGADGIVTICMSSTISATYQAAVIAAEQVVDLIPIRVIDSQSMSMAMGLQVTAAAAAAATGATLDEVAIVAVDASAKTNLVAVLDTLEYLRRGRHVGSTAAAAAGLLNVKPLICFEGGAVTAAGRVRTRSRALTTIIDRVVTLSERIDALAVVHGDATDIDVFLGRLRAALPMHHPIVAELGPVVGTHAGPGAIGLAYRLI